MVSIQQLDFLLEQYLAKAVSKTDGDSEPRAQLLEALSAANGTSNSQTETQETEPVAASVIQVCSAAMDSFFELLWPIERLQDKHINWADDVVECFKWIWMHQLANNEYHNEFDPLLSFLTKILGPYDHHGGRTLDKVLDKFSQHFKAIKSKTPSSQLIEKVWKMCLFDFNEFQKQVKTFEERVCQFEIQAFNNASASDRATFLIEKAMYGHSVPAWLFRFVQDYWHRYFHLVVLKHGKDSELEQKGVELLAQLMDVMKITEAAEVQQLFATKITPLRTNIRDLLNQIIVNEQELEAFFEQLEIHHITILEGSTPEGENVGLAKPPREITTALEVPAAIKQIRVRDWFLLREYNSHTSEYFCRVAERNLNYGFLLLCNYSGARVASLTFEEVEQLTNSGKLSKLSLAQRYEQTIESFELQLKQQIEHIEKEEESKNKANVKRLLLSRLEQSKQQRMAVKVQQREAKQRAIEREESIAFEQKVKETEAFFDKLIPGATFIDHTSESSMVQFVVKLRNQLLVFVNKRGVRVGQWPTRYLAERLVSGEWEVLSTRQSTEQTMEQLVAHQRQSKISSTGAGT
ncbi:MAG: DUF1631 family protein [Gammaproteobacteria bacterium]|nr:DUF1631 family protein [Gammaproteobacteria bacterium]